MRKAGTLVAGSTEDNDTLAYTEESFRSVRVPARFDPASHTWGSRPAMPGLWPVASLLWPVCERGRLSAILPRDNSGPLSGAGSSGSFGTRTCLCPGPRGVGPTRSAGPRWPSSTGQVACRRGGWSGSFRTGRPPATWVCTRRGGRMTGVKCAGCAIC